MFITNPGKLTKHITPMNMAMLSVRRDTVTDNGIKEMAAVNVVINCRFNAPKPFRMYE